MKIKVMAIAAAVSVLLGCASVDTMTGEKRELIKNEFTQTAKAAKEQVESERKYSHIKFDDTFHVPKMREVQDRPDWWDTQLDLAFQRTTMLKALGIIQKQTKIVPRFLPPVDPEKVLPLHHTGDAGDAIQKIALSTGYGVEIDGSIVTFTQFETAHIPVVLPPSVTSFRIGEKDEQGQARQGGYDGVQVAQEEQSNSYSAIESKDLDPSTDLLQVMLTLKSEQGKVAYDRQSSLLTVVDYPKNVKDIREFVGKVNGNALTNVAFDFQFVEFREEDGFGGGINWNLALDDIKATPNVEILGLASGVFTNSFLGSAAPLSLGFEALNGKWAGSELLIEALDNQGSVFVHKQPRVFASHNRLARFDVGTDRAYAANATSNQNQTSTASSLTAGLLSLGIEISVLPTVIQETGEVYVQLGINLNDLNNIEEFSSDGTRIQLPETGKQKFTMTFSALDGETILLSGNRSNRSQYNSTSNGLISMLLGGARASTEENSELLIMITPRIMKRRA